MKEKIMKAINNPRLMILFLFKNNKFKFLSDKIFLKMKYYLITGRKLNLDVPKLYNEKLQWLKLYDRNPEYSKFVDKYKVREYIGDSIGEEFLIPLFGVYASFEDIDFDSLPNEFVVKPNHTSGDIFICRDKRKIDMQSLRTMIERWMKREYFWLHREWPYKNVEPKIIIEKLMLDESEQDLKDYKVFCFSGLPKIIQVDYDRFSKHKRNFYDTEWNYQPLSIKYPTDPNVNIKKPRQIKKMLELSNILARDYPHVRIDFYFVNNRIYFGEITFYQEAGFGEFNPKEFESKMGGWINIENLE